MAHKNISDMEDLENIGWGHMSTILNKEMPLQKKNNRVLFWWIGSAAAAIALIISLSIANKSELKIDAPAISEVHKSINETNKADKNPESITSKISSPKEPIKIESSTPIQLSNNQTTKITNSNSPEETNEVPSQITHQITKEHPEKLTVHNREASLPSQTTAVRIVPEVINYEKETFLLNTITSDLNFQLFKNSPKIDVPSIRLNSRSKFRYGFNVLYGNATKNAYSELGLGIIGNWSINNRWSIISSLNFLRRDNLFNNQSFSELESADAALSNSGGQTSSLDPLDRSIESANEIKLSQLTMQFGIQYQLSPKWALNGSIIPSYSILDMKEYNDWYNDPSRSFQVPVGGASVNSRLISPKTWNVHLDLGLNYALTDQFVLGLNYSYLPTRRGQGTLVDPNFESDEWRFSFQYLLD